MKGSHFWVAGGCLPFAYELPDTCLPVADNLFHGQTCQPVVRGAVLVLLVVEYRLLVSEFGPSTGRPFVDNPLCDTRRLRILTAA